MHHDPVPRFPVSLAALLLGVAVSLLAAPAPAEARIYRWVDADGRVHFSDILEQVPEGQRPQHTASEPRSAPVEVAVALPPSASPADRAAPAASVAAIADVDAPGARGPSLDLFGPLAPVVGRLGAGSLLFLVFLVSPPLAVAFLALDRLRLQRSPSSRSKSA